MNASEKRELLEAMDILIRRPAATTEKTMLVAIQGFGKLLEELTDGYMTVVPVEKKNIDKAFKDKAMGVKP